ncbi:5-carboxymethyl-2-hydroxymuconate Delta-isomerase [Actibacterium sp. D379-3]
MPHIVIEYSAALDDSHDMHAVCAHVFDAAAATGTFPDTTAIKVRALPCAYSVIGTEPQSFAHATVRLLAGRDLTTKAAVTQAILAALAEKLPKVGSLSVDIKDIEAATYAKRTL